MAGGETKVATSYEYTVHFPHSSIISNEAIYLYDEFGAQLSSSPLGPNDTDVNYGRGIWSVPSYIDRSEIMSLATASYYINYGDNKVRIDHNNGKIAVKKSLLSKDRNDEVSASFYYTDVRSDIGDILNLIDGSWDTQTEVVFYGQPTKGLHFGVVDLGSIQDVDAIDLTAGFFEPKEHVDDPRRFEITNWYTLEYSTDDVTYYPICRAGNYFQLSSGESISFETDELGESFQMRYLRIKLEDSQGIEYKGGVWVVSLARLAIYKDILLKGEAILIPSGTETDTTLLDRDNILPKVGDKLYKDSSINRFLDTQTKINRRAKNLLKEFYKNHTKVTVSIEIAAHLELGMTVLVEDSVNSVSEKYFIEGINKNVAGGGQTASLILARYPGLYG